MDRTRLLEIADSINQFGRVPPQLSATVTGDVAQNVYNVFAEQPAFREAATQRGTPAARLSIELGIRAGGAVPADAELDRLALGLPPR